MTKPKRRSKRDTPATGTRQSARVKGRTPAPPEPHAWETVTTLEERAIQISKIMDWYVNDIRDGRHMKQEWILLHMNYIVEYRDRISEHSIQQRLLDDMAKVHFPYVHKRAWNVVQFWVDPGGRNTYPPVDPDISSPTPTPTPPPTPPPDPMPSAANKDTASDLPHMTAFEKLLAENATIIALTETPTRTTPPSPPSHHDTHLSYPDYEPGVEESKEEPPHIIRLDQDILGGTPRKNDEESYHRIRKGQLQTGTPTHMHATNSPPSHNSSSPSTAKADDTTSHTSRDSTHDSHSDDTTQHTTPTIPTHTTLPQLQTQVHDLTHTVRQQQAQIQRLLQMEKVLHRTMDREIEQRYDLFGADYHHVVQSTYEKWQLQLDKRVETSRHYTQKMEHQYELWHHDMHTRRTEAAQMLTTLQETYNDYLRQLKRQLRLAQADIHAHITINEQRHDTKTQENLEQTQKNFTSWLQVTKQQTLDATNTQLKELRDDCFAQIEEEFDVQAANLRSEMDCLRTHVKHVTREEMEIYKTKIRQYHTPPPADTIPDNPSPPRTPTPPTTNKHRTPDTVPAADTPHPAAAMRPPPPNYPIPSQPPRWAPNINIAAFRQQLETPAGSPNDAEQPASTFPPAPPPPDTYHTTNTTTSAPRSDRYLDPEYQIASLRKTSPTMQLTGTTADDVLSFYNSFADFLSSFRIPILHAADLTLDAPVYPTDVAIAPTLLQRYSAAIYTRLEEHGVIDQTISRYKGLIQQHNGTRDGYRVLQQLIRPYLDSQSLTNIPLRPEFSTTDSIYTFAAALTKYFTAQRRRYRNYPRLEQAILYLHGAINDSDYTEAARSILYDLAKLTTKDPLDPKFYLDMLPGTLEAQRALITPPTTTSNSGGTRINATSTRDRRHPNTPNRSSPSSGTPRTMRDKSTNRMTQPTRRTLEAQCEACGMYGHQDPSSCTFIPRVALCIDYIRNHEKTIKGITQAWKHRNNPTVKRLAREQIVKQLQVHLPDHTDIEIDNIARSITDDDEGTATKPIILDHDMDNYSQPTDDHITSSPTTAIGDSNYYTQPTHQNRVHVQYLDPQAWYPPLLCKEIQPVLLPPSAFLHGTDTPHSETHNVFIQRIIQIDSRKHQLADTGANFSVTDNPRFLHDYTTVTPYETTGYDGKTTKATGHGIMKVLNNFGNIECHTIIHSAEADGTIISVEHHAKSNPQIHKWEQTSIPSEYRGWITFYGEDNTIVSRYDTIRHNGLYYITNLNIISPTHPADIYVAHTNLAPQQCADIHQDPDTNTMGEDEQDVDDNAYDITLDNEYIPAQLHLDQPLPTDNPIRIQSTYSTIPNATHHHSQTTLEKDMLNFEIWHQRLGHASESKLRKTQRCAMGIPQFHTPTLPSIVRCRICDIARLQKAPKGGAAHTDPPDLAPGQMFQMDIGFFRGPSNLAAVVDRQEDPQLKIIESRQGYVCYLLIIDRKTRKVWIFPLKSRSVPITLISMFLQLHGNRTPQRRWIRTDGEGALAKSSTFRTELLNKFGYLVELTATDSSSQNAIAERPHRTFGIMVRCMLYASQLPIIFWADAYVYANYIYDRLYHTSIGTTPYEAWTGNPPKLAHIRTFGAHVIVKRSGTRPTKADPHYYDGNFLRFAATEKNIVYWDRITKREKLARHCTIDEFHFGSKTRPPFAQNVIDRLSPNKTSLGNTSTKDIIHLHDIDGIIPALHDLLPDYNRPQHNTAVAATTYSRMTAPQQQQEEIVHMEESQSIYTNPVTVQLAINRLPTLGFILQDDPQLEHPILRTCQEGTQAYRLPSWRSRLKGALLLRLDGQRITTTSDFISHLNQLRTLHRTHATLMFAKMDTTSLDNTGVPQLHFDQLRHIHHILTHNSNPAPNATGNTKNPHDSQKLPVLTRKKLKLQPDFHLWQASEYAQHNKYRSQGMFGDPIPKPHNAITLPFVWTYIYKDGKPKARATCNGGPRYGKAVTLAQTYANCVEQPACRLFWSLAARHNYIVLGADAGNAFAEAPPPNQAFYMIIDEQYSNWWTLHLQRPPIPLGYVLPVNHALQGHPEAPRLWEHHINRILTEQLQFTPTTHEPCLYAKGDTPDTKILFLRQVDDFAVAATTISKAREIITQIGENLIVPLNDLGQIQKFNGVNILQTKHYIKVSCEDYLRKILTQHAWHNLPAAQKPVPMQSNSQHQTQLESTPIQPLNPKEQLDHQNQAGFSYRAAIGELIYALITARPDISYSTTKLAQYSATPQPCHYAAVKQIFAYLNATTQHGLIYWRTNPRDDLPDLQSDHPISNLDHQNVTTPIPVPQLTAYTDSDWGSDRTHRRSVTGTILMYSGATILYKTRYQPAVALSSTEAEFVAASDTGKSILYIRSLLHELGYLQSTSTPLLVDNRGALYMVEAQAPTKRTRHVDIRYFALLQWQNQKHLVVIPVPTADNISDTMTKATGRIKFHQHTDIYMGRTRPTHGRSAAQRISVTQTAFDHSLHLVPTLTHCTEVDSTGG